MAQSSPSHICDQFSSSSSPSISPQPRSQSPSKRPRPSTKLIPRKRQRHATLYDAVAGRITTSGFHIPSPPTTHNPTNPKPTRNPLTAPRLTPSEVLFKRPNAPDRIAEYDIYAAHTRLGWSRSPSFSLQDDEDQDQDQREEAAEEEHHQPSLEREGENDAQREADTEEAKRRKRRKLPDGETLRAIHAYVAEFYAALSVSVNVDADADTGITDTNTTTTETRSRRRLQKNIDTASLDETALLALGILIEESITSALGESGECVFVEGGAEITEEEGGEEGMSENLEDIANIDVDMQDASDTIGQQGEPSLERNKRKKLKKTKDSNDDTMRGKGKAKQKPNKKPQKDGKQGVNEDRRAWFSA